MGRREERMTGLIQCNDKGRQVISCVKDAEWRWLKQVFEVILVLNHPLAITSTTEKVSAQEKKMREYPHVFRNP